MLPSSQVLLSGFYLQETISKGQGRGATHISYGLSKFMDDIGWDGGVHGDLLRGKPVDGIVGCLQQHSPQLMLKMID